MVSRSPDATVLDVMMETPLFEGLTVEQAQAVIERLCGRFVDVKKGCRIFPLHQEALTFAFLAEGRVEVSRTDAWGNKHVFNVAERGATLGGVLAFSAMERPPADAVALVDCRLVVFNRKGITFEEGDPLCPALGKVSVNFSKILLDSKLDVMEHCHVLSQRSVRKKIMTYLALEEVRAGSRSFTIPYTREQLANYLNVDRSMLSTELSALRSAGMIENKGSDFTILK